MISIMRLLIVVALIVLTGCFQSVANPGIDLNFVNPGEMDYAIKVAPLALLQQVREENISPDWRGDPRRFSALKLPFVQGNVYLIDPSLKKDGCPDTGCDLNLIAPLCGHRGLCATFVYRQVGDSYEKILDEYISTYSGRESESVPPLEVSRQLVNDYPCLRFNRAFDEQSYRVQEFCFERDRYSLRRSYLKKIEQPPSQTQSP